MMIFLKTLAMFTSLTMNTEANIHPEKQNSNENYIYFCLVKSYIYYHILHNSQ